MLILSVQDVKPCGVQRADQDPGFGFEYRGQCFDFLQPAWMDYSTALHHYRTQAERLATAEVLLCLLQGAQGYRLCCHDPAIQQVPIPQLLQTLCEKMSAEPGLVDSRRWRLRVFECCFIGHDAVTWLQDHLHIPRREALVIGRACARLGLFTHVLGEQDFADAPYYYRFRWHGEPENRVVPNISSLVTDLSFAWDPSVESGEGAEVLRDARTSP